MQNLIAILAGIIIYAVLMQLFKVLNKEEVRLSRRLESIEQRNSKSFVSQRAEDLDKPLYERLLRPLLSVVGNGLRKITGGLGIAEDGEKKLQDQLNHAGSLMTADEYNASRLGLTLITAVISILMVLVGNPTSTNRLLILMIGFTGPYIVMRYSLGAKVTKRIGEIERQLPEVLDLLSVSVEAGLGFEQAVAYIINNMEGPLIDELEITLREITMGRTRKSAFILLGERCGAETVKSFVSSLVQATEMGISMKTLLHSQSDAMRLHRKRVVEEKAMKLSTQLLFPLVFFIFPSIFVVLLGPGLMNIMGAF